MNGERTIFSTNGAVTTRYTQAKEQIWNPTSHHIQKVTKNDQRFKCKNQNFITHRRKQVSIFMKTKTTITTLHPLRWL